MKKKILLRTLIPLAAVGITLGTALPLVSCSCGSEQSTKTDLSSAYTNPTAYPLQPTNDQIFDFAKTASSALNSSGLTKYDFVWSTTPGSPAIMTVKSDNPDYTGTITVYYTASTSLWIDLLGDVTLEDDIPIIEGTVSEAGSHNFKIYDNLNNPIHAASITITRSDDTTPDPTGIVSCILPASDVDSFHLEWTNGTTEETIYKIIIQATTDNGLTGSLLVHLDIRPKAASPFTIDASNFSTYFNGTLPNTGTLKGPVFSEAIVANKTNKLIFDISGDFNIDNTTFSGCSAFRDLSSPLSIEFAMSGAISIGRQAFLNCIAISQIILSNATLSSLTIGQSAFTGCQTLTGFSRGGQAGIISVTSIGTNAFSQCENLKYEEINNSIISLPSTYTWTPGTDANSGYWIQNGATDLYTAGCLAVGAISCPPSWTSIEQYAFMHCSSLTEIDNLPGGTVGLQAFLKCTRLTKVQFKLGIAVTNINTQAFNTCTRLSSIELSSSGWTIGSTIGSLSFVGCAEGGTISGTNSADLLAAIHATNSDWLKDWSAS